MGINRPQASYRIVVRASEIAERAIGRAVCAACLARDNVAAGGGSRVGAIVARGNVVKRRGHTLRQCVQGGVDVTKTSGRSVLLGLVEQRHDTSKDRARHRGTADDGAVCYRSVNAAGATALVSCAAHVGTEYIAVVIDRRRHCHVRNASVLGIISTWTGLPCGLGVEDAHAAAGRGKLLSGAKTSTRCGVVPRQLRNVALRRTEV